MRSRSLTCFKFSVVRNVKRTKNRVCRCKDRSGCYLDFWGPSYNSRKHTEGVLQRAASYCNGAMVNRTENQAVTEAEMMRSETDLSTIIEKLPYLTAENGVWNTTIWKFVSIDLRHCLCNFWMVKALARRGEKRRLRFSRQCLSEMKNNSAYLEGIMFRNECSFWDLERSGIELPNAGCSTFK